jgi:cell division transport system permease protein
MKKLFTRLHFATMTVLLASFCVIAGVLTMSHNLSNVLTLWGESLQVSVYLDESATPEGISAVDRFLNQDRNVDKINFVTKEQALNQFRDQMASYAPDLLNDGDLLKFIPASFQFSLNKTVPTNEHLSVLQALASSLKMQAGVAEVSYGQDWIKSYSALTQGLQWVGALFILIIFVSAGFVMSNSIQSSIQQRRSEIEVLELIGATAKYIRRPFIIESAAIAGLSSSLALALCYGIFVAAKSSLREQISMMQLSEHIEFIPVSQVLGVVLFSIVLGGLASWICVRSINTGWAASLKTKIAGEPS